MPDFSNQMGGLLQKLLDPNYQRVQQEMSKGRNQQDIKSDSNTYSLQDLMSMDPRFQGWMAAQDKNTSALTQDNTNPMNSDILNKYLMQILMEQMHGSMQKKNML